MTGFKDRTVTSAQERAVLNHEAEAKHTQRRLHRHSMHLNERAKRERERERERERLKETERKDFSRERSPSLCLSLSSSPSLSAFCTTKDHLGCLEQGVVVVHAQVVAKPEHGRLGHGGR